jgi:hypothetical protein
VAGEHHGEFGIAGAVISGRMKQTAVEKQHVARVQFGIDLLF